MAEFESPVTKSYPVRETDLVLSDESSLTKTVLRADPSSPAAHTAGVGFGRTRRQGDVLVVGTRPGEWTVIGDADATAAFVADIDRSGHVSTIDHTHARAMFRLTGQSAPRALEKICSVDWSDDMTPDGAAVSASVAKVNCDLVRDDTDSVRSYLIICDRSFGQYLFEAVLDAADEFGGGVR